MIQDSSQGNYRHSIPIWMVLFSTLGMMQRSVLFLKLQSMVFDPSVILILKVLICLDSDADDFFNSKISVFPSSILLILYKAFLLVSL